MENFNIPYKGLSDGSHLFELEVDDTFFSEFPQSEITSGNLKVLTKLEKSSLMLSFEFHVNGTISVQCDRCLDFFDYPIDFVEHLYVKFGLNSSDISDVLDTMVLSFDESHVDLATHIYEYIMLAKSVRNVHPKDKKGKSTCNQEMIQTLKKFKSKEEKTMDPRWEILQTKLNTEN